jgi:signal transduction histidine kinase
MTNPEGGIHSKPMDATAFGEVATALSLLGSEVIHEVTHTLHFLRFLQQEACSSTDPEIVRFAGIELDRMQHLLVDLRRFKLPAPEMTDASLSWLVGQCIERVRESAAPCLVSVEVGIPSEIVVWTDVGCLDSALQNLLRDAFARVPKSSPVVIGADASAGHPLWIEVSDAGEALPDRDAVPLDWRDLASPLAPTFRRMMAYRLLRHIGWSMSYERQGDRNVFRLTAPMSMSPSP